MNESHFLLWLAVTNLAYRFFNLIAFIHAELGTKPKHKIDHGLGQFFIQSVQITNKLRSSLEINWPLLIILFQIESSMIIDYYLDYHKV